MLKSTVDYYKSFLASPALLHWWMPVSTLRNVHFGMQFSLSVYFWPGFRLLSFFCNCLYFSSLGNYQAIHFRMTLVIVMVFCYTWVLQLFDFYGFAHLEQCSSPANEYLPLIFSKCYFIIWVQMRLMEW